MRSNLVKKVQSLIYSVLALGMDLSAWDLPYKTLLP